MGLLGQRLTAGWAWPLVLACGNSKPPSSLEVPDLAGAWYAADLHVHSVTGSNDTSPENFVDTIAEVARARSLSLVVITDHSNSAGSMDCATGDVEDCPNQGPEFPSRDAAHAATGDGLVMVTGVEISPTASLESTLEPRGHVGCIPLPGDPFEGVVEPAMDRPVGEVSGGEGVVWCQSIGGMAIVNHPVTIAGWLAYDWTSDAYDGIEVFNGSARFDEGDARSVDAWMCDLVRGADTVPVGGSDSHDASTPSPPPELLDQALGFPTTWVRAESDERDVLLQALASGHVVVGDPRTRLELVVQDESEAVGPGQTLSTTASEVQVHLSAVADAGDVVLELIEVTEDTCEDDTRFMDGATPSAEPVVHISTALVSGEHSEEQLRLTVEQGRTLIARVWPTADPIVFEEGVALTNAVRVLPAQ